MDAEPKTTDGGGVDALAQTGPTLAALERVAVLCAEGNAEGAIETLLSSGYPNRVVARLGYLYRSVPRDLRQDAVADGVAALHQAVVAGRPVRRPGGYLFKVAESRCAEEQRRLEAQRTLDGLEGHQLAGAHAPWADHEGAGVRARRRAAAVCMARELLPRLGQQRAQLVMGFVFDAVEQGRVHVTSRDIADALDLSDDVVRQSLSRGFRRLERLARESGLDVRAGDLLEDLDLDPDDPEEGQQ